MSGGSIEPCGSVAAANVASGSESRTENMWDEDEARLMSGGSIETCGSVATANVASGGESRTGNT